MHTEALASAGHLFPAHSTRLLALCPQFTSAYLLPPVNHHVEGGDFSYFPYDSFSSKVCLVG